LGARCIVRVDIATGSTVVAGRVAGAKIAGMTEGSGRPPVTSELAPDVPYAYTSIVPAGWLLVFTAGSCPLDPSGATVTPGDVAGQAEQVMDNLDAALRQAGAGLADVVKTTVYVASTEREDLLSAWNVVHRRFDGHEPPSTLLGVSGLGWPGQLVEVEAVAAIAGEDEKFSSPRRIVPVPFV
jgi:enamine deaminase RidA (YjgF/YER057c/UK114 family)